MVNDDNNESLDLDDVDRALITALQEDGRCGYAELGALVGLTAGGARKRVMRLEERGAIQIVGVTDPLRLGYQSMAMVGIVSSGDVFTLADELGESPNVVYTVLTSGQFDLIVEVLAKDQASMFTLINNTIRKHPSVLRAETFTYHSIHTHRFGWGT